MYHGASCVENALLCVEQVPGVWQGELQGWVLWEFRGVSDSFRLNPAQGTAEHSTATAGGTSAEMYLR